MTYQKIPSLIVLFSLFAITVFAADPPACRVVSKGTRVELHSPFFVFQLDTEKDCMQSLGKIA